MLWITLLITHELLTYFFMEIRDQSYHYVISMMSEELASEVVQMFTSELNLKVN